MQENLTDKDLLEMAAKAAGVAYDAEASKQKPGINVFWGLWLKYEGEVGEYTPRYWNPFTDDGDALRLAVKLDLLNDPRFLHERDVLMFTKNMSKLQATRHAFVIAAAHSKR